jgi:hypothetical protein
MAHHARNYRALKMLTASERRCDPMGGRIRSTNVPRPLVAMFLKRLKIALLDGNAGRGHRIVDEFAAEIEPLMKRAARP